VPRIDPSIGIQARLAAQAVEQAMDRFIAPPTEPDLRARIRLFGSIDHSASESWYDACEVLSSSQRALSETRRPMNQDGG
jgi:hypothetical protein